MPTDAGQAVDFNEAAPTLGRPSLVEILGGVNNSYSIVIRDNILRHLKTWPFFQNFKTFGRSKRPQVQPEDLPHVAVYLLDDMGAPDGDANVGEVRFLVTLRIGFAVWILNNDSDLTENILDSAFRVIMDGVLRNPKIYNDPNAQIEAFTRFVRSNSYGTTERNNELPVAAMRIELTCTYREMYEPDIHDVLERVHTTVLYPDGDPGRDQIIAEWEIETE